MALPVYEMGFELGNVSFSQHIEKKRLNTQIGEVNFKEYNLRLYRGVGI